MEPWQHREKHELDTASAFEAAGCTFFPNSKVVRKWNGPEFQKQLELRGHTAMGFERCDCHKKK